MLNTKSGVGKISVGGKGKEEKKGRKEDVEEGNYITMRGKKGLSYFFISGRTHIP